MSAPIELDASHPVRGLASLLGRHRGRVALAVAVFVVKDSPLWLLPVVTASVVDVVVAGGPTSRLVWLAAGAAVLLGQNYPFHMLFTRLFMGAARQIGADLRNALAARLQVLSIGYHARSSASVIQSKLVRDVENIEFAPLQTAQPLLSAINVFLGATVMTALQVPRFLPVFALAVPCGAALWWVVRRSSARRNEAFRRQVEGFSSRVGEMATMLPVTRAHGLEHVAVARMQQGAEGVREAGIRLDVLNGRFGAISWITLQLLTVGCLLAAAWVSLAGWIDITPGQVVLLGTYFSLLTGAVTSALSLAPLMARAGESIKSIAEVLQDPDVELNEGRIPVESVAGHLRFEDVTFAYPDSDAHTLEGVSLDIPAGTTVALVGASGAGKSTLLNIVLGFLRPRAGHVLLDGHDMGELDLRTVRRHVSVVPQESMLFEGSIRDNVTYGLGEVDDARLLDALTAAHAMEFIDRLPDGVDTVVGERGARLSGGQRQRLSIARALIRDPRILLLDEATSALDSESEAMVKQALQRLLADRTALVVAHRLSTVRAADLIVVLDAGRIVETGTHDELVVAGGHYARLNELQGF